MARITNPAFMQSYRDEAMVGTTTKVWKATKHGRYRNTAQNNVLMRRLLGLCLRMEGYQ